MWQHHDLACLCPKNGYFDRTVGVDGFQSFQIGTHLPQKAFRAILGTWRNNPVGFVVNCRDIFGGDNQPVNHTMKSLIAESPGYWHFSKGLGRENTGE